MIDLIKDLLINREGDLIADLMFQDKVVVLLTNNNPIIEDQDLMEMEKGDHTLIELRTEGLSTKLTNILSYRRSACISLMVDA